MLATQSGVSLYALLRVGQAAAYLQLPHHSSTASRSKRRLPPGALRAASQSAGCLCQLRDHQVGE